MYKNGAPETVDIYYTSNMKSFSQEMHEGVYIRLQFTWFLSLECIFFSKPRLFPLKEWKIFLNHQTAEINYLLR